MDGPRNIVTSTPMLEGTSRSKTFPMNGEKYIPKIPEDGRKVNQTTLQMVCEAIEVMGIPRKGASYQTIVKYVKNKKEDPGRNNMNYYIRKAVAKGIESGLLVRPAKGKDWKGVTGFLILQKPEKKVKDAPSKPKMPRVHKRKVSDSEVIVKKPKRKEKLNLSDTVVKYNTKTTKPKTKLAKAKIEKPSAKTLKAKAKLEKDEKIPKAAVKTSKEKNAKTGVKAKKLPVKEEVTEDMRKDVSDSEYVVKKPGRKSLKSYSSDTDIDRASRTSTIIKQKKTAQKKGTKAAKNKVTGGEPPAKLKGKKLFKASEQDLSEKVRTAKVGKTSIKK